MTFVPGRIGRGAQDVSADDIAGTNAGGDVIESVLCRAVIPPIGFPAHFEYLCQGWRKHSLFGDQTVCKRKNAEQTS